MNLLALIDQAVAEGLAAHESYLSAYGKEGGRAHKMIVRKVTKALRESLSAPKDDEPAEAPQREPEAPSPYFQCDVWSREWWALFFAEIDRGRSVRFMLENAIKSEKGAVFTVTRDRTPPPDLVECMRAYPSDGDAAIKWRLWLNRKGIRLPDWRGRMWIFLPSDAPESEITAA
jgi:hypothetical protein